MENNRPNQDHSEQKIDSKNSAVLKPWHAPKLVIEDTENTKGGTFTCNSPGDDAWYSS